MQHSTPHSQLSPGNILLKSADTFNVTAALCIFLLSYSLLLGEGRFLLQDPDTMWHIVTGQWILDHARVPTVDPYSYTEAGKPWISTEWFAEILYALAFKLGGWTAVTIFAVTACSAILGILCFYLLQNLRFTVAIGWAIAAAAATSPHFIARPHIISYVILAIWIVKLLNDYDNDTLDLRSLRVFAPLMILWANIHGSFTLGLTLLYIFAGLSFLQNFVHHDYTRCRRLAVVVSAVTLCAFITPYGMLPAFMTTKLMNMKFALSYIVEWHSPNFQDALYRPFYLIGILCTIAGFGIRLTGPRLVAYALITFMGLRYSRALLMFFFLAPFILARPAGAATRFLAPQLPGVKDDEGASDPVLDLLKRRSTAILIGCLALAAVMTIWTSRWREMGPPKINTPEAALEFVRSKNIKGNVFNDYLFGGFLIWSHIPTFIDGRAELFGDDFVRQYAETVNLTDIDKAFKVLDDYNVTWVILTPTQPLAKALTHGPWDAAYSDKYAVVFTRRPSVLPEQR